MKELWLCALLMPVVASAELGDTKAEAATRWGDPVNSENGAYAYESDKYDVVQYYNDDGKCMASVYYKKDGSEISLEESIRLDTANFLVLPWPTWHEVPSGKAGVKQWNNSDDTLGIIAGLVPFDDGRKLYSRAFFTKEGALFLKAKGWL
jgi:hypothetical protein